MLRVYTERTRAHIRYLSHTIEETSTGSGHPVVEGAGVDPNPSAPEQPHPDGTASSLGPWGVAHQAPHSCALFGPLDMRDGGRAKWMWAQVGSRPVQGHCMVSRDPSLLLSVCGPPPPSAQPGVIASCGCCSKLLQNWCLQTTQMHYLTVLARRLKSGCQQGRAPQRLSGEILAFLFRPLGAPGVPQLAATSPQSLPLSPQAFPPLCLCVQVSTSQRR